MRTLILAVVAALLTLSALPAVAQDTTSPAAAAPAAEAETPPTPEEAAFAARGQAFGADTQKMAEEMQAAIVAAGADTAKKTADLDAIQAHYQSSADSFAEALQTFVTAQANAELAAHPEASLDELTRGLDAGLAQIKAIPAKVRTRIEQEAATPARTTAPAAE